MNRKKLPFFLVLTLGLVVGTGVGAQDPDYVLDITDGSGSIGGVASVDFTTDITGAAGLAGWSWGICQTPAGIVDITAVADGSATAALNDGDGADFNAPTLIPGEGWTIGVVVNLLGMTSLAPGIGLQLHIGDYNLLAEGSATLSYCDTLGNPIVQTVLVDDIGNTIIPTILDGTIDVVSAPPPFTYDGRITNANYDQNTGVGSFTVSPTIVEDPANPGYPNDTQGFSMGLGHDSNLLTASTVDPAAALGALNGGSGPDFFGPQTLADGITVGVVYSLLATDAIAYDTAIEVLTISYDTVAGTLAGDADGEVTALSWIDTLGTPTVQNVVVIAGVSQAVLFNDGVINLNPQLEPVFVRGDCNDDGAVNIADGIWALNAMFQGGPPVTCAEACDAQDDGLSGDISDAMYIFNYRLFDGPTPPAPFPACGTDANPGAACDTYNSCP